MVAADVSAKQIGVEGKTEVRENALRITATSERFIHAHAGNDMKVVEYERRVQGIKVQNGTEKKVTDEYRYEWLAHGQIS